MSYVFYGNIFSVIRLSVEELLKKIMAALPVNFIIVKYKGIRLSESKNGDKHQIVNVDYDFVI